MQLQVEVVDVSQPQFTTTAQGGYNKVDLAYRKDGKIEGRPVVDFNTKEAPNNKQIYAFIRTLKAGDVIDVVAEKGVKYWNWISVTKAAAGTVAPQTAPQSAPQTAEKGGRVTGSNYETPQERARKQVFIVRQSSVSTAIEFFDKNGKAPKIEEVFETARQIERFVMEGYDVYTDGQFREVTKLVTSAKPKARKTVSEQLPKDPLEAEFDEEEVDNPFKDIE